MERIEIYKSQWVDWKKSFVTKALVQDILHKREALKEGLAEGHFSTENDRLLAMGRCQSMKDIIEYIIEFFEVVDDKEEDEKGES